ncbi:MAG: IS5 family transposase [Burkholderiaceae bacterium]|nr:IS5 family transposase [Burkholderiaceae bacterium]
MRYCRWSAQAVRGAIYRRNLARGTASRCALHDGRTRWYGKVSLQYCLKMPALRKFISLAQRSVLTNMRLEPLKKGEQALGRSRGGLTVEIHDFVEGLGQLARFVLASGQVHDVTQTQVLIEQMQLDAVLADKPYDANALLTCFRTKNAKAVIPPKTNRLEQREFDRLHYRNRNVIERFFATLKQFRRVATRHDKLASRFGSFVDLAASVLWLR